MQITFYKNPIYVGIIGKTKLLNINCIRSIPVKPIRGLTATRPEIKERFKGFFLGLKAREELGEFKRKINTIPLSL
jgi:hypothetical protein